MTGLKDLSEWFAFIGLCSDLVGVLILAADFYPSFRLSKAHDLLDEARRQMEVRGLHLTDLPRVPADRWDWKLNYFPSEQFKKAASLLRVPHKELNIVEGTAETAERVDALLSAALFARRKKLEDSPVPPLSLGLALVIAGFMLQAIAAFPY
jgi:hypothetical protein